MNKIKRLAGMVSEGFVNAFLPDYKNDSKGIYFFGERDNLPNELLKAIADSGVATRAMNKVAEYIAADGFTDEVSAKVKVNSNQTADQLLQEISVYVASLNAVALHISRVGGKVAEVRALPVQCVRKTLNGDYLFNQTYGQIKFEKDKDKIYPPFVPRDLTLTEIASGKYSNGEILYAFRKTPFNSHYPVPDYYAQIEDVRTASEISKMDYELSINGFMPSSIITIIGNVDTVTKDSDGYTEEERIKEDFKKFTGRSKDSNGVSGRFKALLQFAGTKEEIPSLQTFDVKSILESSNSKRDIIDRAVCRLFGVHPVLMGYSDAAVLGNTQAIANASLELNKVVNPYQRLISDVFKMVFQNNDWTISEYMPITYIDPALYPDMTQDERRNKLLGLPPLAVAPVTPVTP